VLDYKLHAALRIIASSKIDYEHIAAFLDTSVRHDQMTAHVFSFVTELRKQRTYLAVSARSNGNGSH
jgi:hypothetical protein